MKTGGDNIQGDQVDGNKVEVGSVSGSQNVAIAGGNIFQRINNFFASDTEAQRAQRNRQNMLIKVGNTWIEGVLKKSLHNEALLELGLETQPEAVEHPWKMQVQETGQHKPELLPAGVSMLEVFERMGGAMLILGDPGSGKTTMLLELCRQAIELAQADPAQPIPVVFNLSSWKPPMKLAEWLVLELKRGYYAPKDVARPWVEHGDLLLLLDGLDEVAAENRSACAQAINDHRASAGATRLAVCCRAAEYEQLAARLKLDGALLIQPLSERQAEEYLEKAGEGLAAARQWFAQDEALRELAQTPLMLSILVLAFHGAEAGALRKLGAEGDYRKRLFDAYIEQMFRRRGAQAGYTPEQTKKYLAWLARQMARQGQTLFYLENIQLGWLAWPEWKIRVVFGVVSGLFVGLVVGLILGLVDRLVGGLAIRLFDGLFGGLIYGLFGGLAAGMSAELDQSLLMPAEQLRWSWEKAKTGLVAGLVLGLVLGLVAGLVLGPVAGLVPGMVLGLVVGLVLGLKSSALETRTMPGEGIAASMKNFIFIGLVLGLLFGLVLGLLFGVVFGVAGWLATGQVGGLAAGLAAWLADGQVLFLVFDLVFGLFFGLFFGLVVGLIYGPVVGLRYGGGFLIVHYWARMLLAGSGRLPWKVLAFLDHCSERILLRRVGGGYIFIHRSMMEHFAAMGEENRPGPA